MALLKKMFGVHSDEEELMDGEEQNWPEEMTDEEIEDAEGQLALDVYQTKDNVIVKSTIAGVKPDDLDITVTDNRVVIRGERRLEEEADEGDYIVQECYWGGFQREMSLPVEVDADAADADLKDGILTITIPKLIKSRSKKLKVNKGE